MSTTPKRSLGRLPLVLIALALHACSITTPTSPPVSDLHAAISSGSSRASTDTKALPQERGTAGAGSTESGEKPPAARNESISRIAPNDLLKVEVAHADELSIEGRVSEKGTIQMPLVGEVALGGLTPREAERRVADILGRDYLQDPQVSVAVVE